jgi:Tol biopolymer transport system component
MRPNGSDARLLAGDPTLDEVFPRWTADGRRVLFHTFPGPEGRPSEDVWVIAADGKNRARLLGDVSADFSPDPRPRG